MLLTQVIQYLFFAYMSMIAIRIIGSWFPSVQKYNWFYWLSRCTDPYLNLFRRIIPPIGGVLDLSPMLAYLSLQFCEWLILRALP
jgi:YggT family protein